MQFVSEQADIGLILLDLNLPDRDGFSILSELRERRPAISVVVLSARQDRDSVVKALDLGALGFSQFIGKVHQQQRFVAVKLFDQVHPAMAGINPACALGQPKRYGKIANTRAGNPEPPFGFGKLITTIAPDSGT